MMFDPSNAIKRLVAHGQRLFKRQRMVRKLQTLGIDTRLEGAMPRCQLKQTGVHD